jgi:hypothetical protein
MAESRVQEGPIRPRNLAFVAIMGVVTLTIYNYYLMYQWAKELNALEGRQRYGPGSLILICIVTLGLAGVIIEIVFARNLENRTRTLRVAGAFPSLAAAVGGLNVAALAIALLTSYGIVALVLGTMASVLVQREFNLLASVWPTVAGRQAV